MLFWHGGNLNDYNEAIKHKGGRHEYGPGLYGTTHYDTAKKYSKGSRKLYLLDIAKGNDIKDADLTEEAVNEFIKSNVTKSKQNTIIERLNKYKKNGLIPAYNLMVIILNEDAIKSSKMNSLREFLVRNNVDYELVSNPFGWHETMIVLYNMQKISNTKQIMPKDEIKEYDLSKVNESESIKSIVACSKANRIARILCVAEELLTDEEDTGLPTLDEFLKSSLRNSYLNVPGFDSFYARKGPYYIEDKVYPKVFQIANIEATTKGEGTFTRLIADLKKKGMPIFVESILNPRLPSKLEELGFRQVNEKTSGTINYFWEK